MTMFDILKDIITDKTGLLVNEPDFDKEFNSFMLARYLSMKTNYIIYGEWINQYGTFLTKENQYKFLIKNVPYSKNSFIQYMKKKTKRKKKDKDEE